MSDSPRSVTAPHDPRAADLDDCVLIQRSVTAPEVFAGLFDRHAPAIYRYIARRLGPDAADDLVSDAFLIAFSRRGSYDCAQPDARPWLYGIATNLIGRRRRDETRFLRALARTGVSGPVEGAADEIAERVAAQAVSGQLAAALADLPAPHRDALLLVAGGLSQSEAALALGVPTGTVASRVARARRKVRAALGGANPTRVGEE